jgi:hypothetical protein
MELLVLYISWAIGWTARYPFGYVGYFSEGKAIGVCSLPHASI